MGATTLEWAVKESLLDYMQRDASFVVGATGGATFVDGVARLPVHTDHSGVIRASGSLVLEAHGGALTVPLCGVHLAEGALWIDDPYRESDEPAGRIRLVTLRAVADGAECALASDADVLFLYRYMPGESFAPLRLRSATDEPVPLPTPTSMP